LGDCVFLELIFTKKRFKMSIKFGLVLPGNEARTVAKLSQMAEESGWDGVFLGDYIWCEDPMIALAAAAMITNHIRLGTKVIPVPIRRPWKIASESLAIDRLSNGRLILGLGTGAVWMGWQSFPDEITDAKARAEMLDETVDILTLLYQCKQFDYDGKHYHLKLTQMDEMHYPPKPVQQPRIPLWAPLIWPRKKSMQRILKFDGLIAEKWSPEGKFEEVTPQDVRQMIAFVTENREGNTPFDIVVSGKTYDMPATQREDVLSAWSQAGATWWVEGLWGESEEAASEYIRGGPPNLE
jgi:hypothetical protein